MPGLNFWAISHFQLRQRETWGFQCCQNTFSFFICQLVLIFQKSIHNTRLNPSSSLHILYTASKNFCEDLTLKQPLSLYMCLIPSCMECGPQCKLPPIRKVCNTRQATRSQPNSVLLPNARVNQHSLSYTYTPGQLGKTRPSSIIHPYYDVSSFKLTVSRHLERNATGFWTSRSGTGLVLVFFSLHLFQYRKYRQNIQLQ